MKPSNPASVLAAAFIAFLTVEARSATVEFTGNGDAVGTSSFTNSASWTAGMPLPIDDAAADHDYVIYRAKNLRTPTKADVIVKAKSFTIGTATSGGNLALANRDKDGCGITFENGVRLVNGFINTFYNKSSHVSGDITIATAAGKDFYSKAHHQCASAGTDANITFHGDLYGDESAKWRLCRTWKYPKESAATNSVFAFSGKMEECASTFELAVDYADDEETAEGYSCDARITFRRVGSAVFPGKFRMNTNTAIDLEGADASFTVGGISFSTNNVLLFDCNTSAGSCGSFKITDSMTFAENMPVTIKIDASGSMPTSEAVVYPLVTAPEGVTLSTENFTLPFVSGYAFRYYVDNDADGRSTLYAKLSPVVTLRSGDSASKQESFREGTDSSITHDWSDGEWPSAGKSYLVEGKSIRTPRTLSGSKAPGFDFLGDTLTIKNGGTFVVRNEVLTNETLYLEAETRNVSVSHYSSGKSGIFPYSQSGTCILRGNWYLSSSPTNWIVLKLATDRCLRYETRMTGDLNLRITAYCEPTSAIDPSGHYIFTKANPGLKGKVQIRYEQNYTWTAGGNITVPTMDYCCRVYVADGGVFGGRLDEFDIKAIQIEDYSVIQPLNDVTFDDKTRGWQINNATGGGKPVARFDVPEGVTMTFRQPLDFHANYATLMKEGDGCLELGDFSPTFWAGNKEPTASVSNNMFKVTDGSVKLLTGKVFNGLQVTFSDDSRLVFDAEPADETLQTYGMYNDIYRWGRTDRTGDDAYLGKPIAPAPGSESLNVEIVSESARAPDVLPLFTVGAEHADEIVGKLKLTHPFASVTATVTVKEFNAPADGGKLATIGVDFVRGSRIIIR